MNRSVKRLYKYMVQKTSSPKAYPASRKQSFYIPLNYTPVTRNVATRAALCAPQSTAPAQVYPGSSKTPVRGSVDAVGAFRKRESVPLLLDPVILKHQHDICHKLPADFVGQHCLGLHIQPPDCTHLINSSSRAAKSRSVSRVGIGMGFIAEKPR